MRRRGLRGGGSRSGAFSDRKLGGERHFHKEIGLSTEAGKLSNLPSLASELGVFFIFNFSFS